MKSFRYHTKTLLGPWRNSAESAVQDAIRAKQARRDENGMDWDWLVPGSIEERQEPTHAYSRNDNFDFSPPEQRQA
jgi:hypothetical protein